MTRIESISDRKILSVWGITDPRATAYSITADSAIDCALAMLDVQIKHERNTERANFCYPKETEENGKTKYFAVGFIVHRLKAVA